MPVIVRPHFSPAIYEAGPLEAIDMMIATLMNVIGSLKEESAPIEDALRRAAIADAERQIAELAAYRAGCSAESAEPWPHRRE